MTDMPTGTESVRRDRERTRRLRIERAAAAESVDSFRDTTRSINQGADVYPDDGSRVDRSTAVTDRGPSASIDGISADDHSHE